MQLKFETLEAEMAHLKKQGENKTYKFRVPFINNDELQFLVKMGYQMFFTTCIKRSGNGVTVICELI